MKRVFSVMFLFFSIVSFSACTVVGMVSPAHRVTAHAVIKVPGKDQKTLYKILVKAGEDQEYKLTPSQNYSMVVMKKHASNGAQAFIGDVDSTLVTAYIDNEKIDLTVQVSANFGKAKELANKRLEKLKKEINE